jgi:hypothetical protein
MAPRPLAGRDWVAIRHDYEQTDNSVHEICTEHRLSATTLHNRARQWNWTLRRAPVPAQGPPPESLPRVEPPLPAGPSPHLSAPLRAAPADARQIAHRLRDAIARVLTAIDAALAGLSAAPHPREIERAGRTVAGLTRTLHELNAMLNQFPVPEEDENDAFFREELAKLERMAIVNAAYRNGILPGT